ncbi:MAG: carotenoid biosynthesis protein [Flavobacteriales bacterium]|nr:carotenoid biosynthesis protein [Flavobacteriales bacterium]
MISAVLNRFTREQRVFGVIVILHTVGAVGLSSPWKELFMALTPVNLILSAGLIFWKQEKNTVLLLMLIGLLAYSLEWVGVHTGYPFGEYSYGGTLGPHISDVPPVIGVNWMIILASSHALASIRFSNNWVIALVGATLMTLLDVLIEPVAIALDFWTWTASEIPIQNYISWWVAAFVFGLILQKWGRLENSIVLKLFFLVQVVFFAVLNMLI